MAKMKLALMTAAVILATQLLSGPVALAQTKADVVKAVSNESDSLAWLADDPHRFGHPDRPEKNGVLAQCFQDALASGDQPKLEAAFLANKAYLEAKISSAITFASENNWNALESTYLAFQLMNKGEDEEEQVRFFSEWILGWGNSFGDETESMKFGDIDMSAQAEVETMYDAGADRGDHRDGQDWTARGDVRQGSWGSTNIRH